MESVSTTAAESARKSHCEILRRLQEPGRQVALATVLGVSESTISRIKNEQLNTICLVLAHLGLKVVPTELVLLDMDKVQAMLVYAKDAWSQVNSVEDLRYREHES